MKKVSLKFVVITSFVLVLCLTIPLAFASNNDGYFQSRISDTHTHEYENGICKKCLCPQDGYFDVTIETPNGEYSEKARADSLISDILPQGELNCGEYWQIEFLDGSIERLETRCSYLSSLSNHAYEKIVNGGNRIKISLNTDNSSERAHNFVDGECSVCGQKKNTYSLLCYDQNGNYLDTVSVQAKEFSGFAHDTLFAVSSIWKMSYKVTELISDGEAREIEVIFYVTEKSLQPDLERFATNGMGMNSITLTAVDPALASSLIGFNSEKIFWVIDLILAIFTAACLVVIIVLRYKTSDDYESTELVGIIAFGLILICLSFCALISRTAGICFLVFFSHTLLLATLQIINQCNLQPFKNKFVRELMVTINIAFDIYIWALSYISELVLDFFRIRVMTVKELRSIRNARVTDK